MSAQRITGDLSRIHLLVFLLTACAGVGLQAAQISTTPPSVARLAPPSAPPFLRKVADTQVSPGALPHKTALTSSLTLYSIGEPTDEEQLYLEFINQARANPQAAAARYRSTTDFDVLDDCGFFGVDLNLMVSQFATLAPVPPLSMNARLMAAARSHSQDMLANQYQGHDGTDGSTIPSRITAQGYDWTFFAENVFSSAQSVWHGHVAFDVDWGGSADTGGMQNPPGHRKAIHEPDFREVGVGIVHGSNGKFGPQVVTQDFGRPRNPTPFVTGVAYYDFNGNSAYDPGEGLGSVTVKVTGSPSYAVTAASGGYSVPVPGNGACTATFSLPGLTDTQRIVAVTNDNNAKLDFVPTYSAPAVSGPDQAVVNLINTYQFTPVAGATSHQWKQNRRVRFTDAEGAETGLNHVSAQTSSGYEVFDASVKASGNFAFHLVHPKPEDQTLTLNRLFRPEPTSQLLFSSRLGFAGTAQTARAEISTDGGITWRDLWHQVGTEDQGEPSLSQQVISLSAFAGQELRVRFRYAFTKGTFYNQTARGVGFYLDDIRLTDTDELLDERVSETPTGSSFVFQPNEPGAYALNVRAKLAQRTLPWGPAKLVTAQIAQPSQSRLRIIGFQSLSANLVQIEFEAVDAPGAGFELQSADTVTGPWGSDAFASVEVVQAGIRFRATTSTDSTPRRFYRIRAR